MGIIETEDGATQSETSIVVAGLGRCGSTFMQSLLSSHPLVHIYGQFPPADLVDLVAFHEFQHRLIEAGSWSQSANEVPICDWPHYAGSDEERTRALFSRFVRNWLSGFPVSAKPRWGLKALSLAYHEPYRMAWESWFPETRYVICVRDPFDSFQSAKNTVAPNAELDDWLYRFVRLVQWHSECDRSCFFHLAGISTEGRSAAVDDLLSFLDLPTSPSVNAVVEAWPMVHKRTPDADRAFTVTNLQREQAMERVDGLAEAMIVLDHLHQDERVRQANCP